jgi:hypothetical protein
VSYRKCGNHLQRLQHRPAQRSGLVGIAPAYHGEQRHEEEGEVVKTGQQVKNALDDHARQLPEKRFWFGV